MRTTTRIILAGLFSVLVVGGTTPAANAGSGKTNIVWCCR
jgi:hypothetical protein